MRVAINGFGRIGRSTLRAWLYLKESPIEIVAINDLISIENARYLLKYDSAHGNLEYDVSISGHNLIIKKENKEISVKYSSSRNVEEIGYKKLDITTVIDCTGLFTTRDRAAQHIQAGAINVLISAPSSDIPMFVYGVNHTDLLATNNIISNASCTTNCLAPIAQVLDECFGIKEGLMTTIHSYTSSQTLIDGPSPKDFRGGRSATINIVPASTGAATAVTKVLPKLKGKLTGMAFRVPTINVSVVDLTVSLKNSTTLEEILCKFKNASLNKLKGVLDVTDEALVSTDINGSTYSSIVDANASMQLNEKFFKIISWYDNECGYSNRLLEILNYMNKKNSG